MKSFILSSSSSVIEPELSGDAAVDDEVEGWVEDDHELVDVDQDEEGHGDVVPLDRDAAAKVFERVAVRIHDFVNFERKSEWENKIKSQTQPKFLISWAIVRWIEVVANQDQSSQTRYFMSFQNETFHVFINVAVRS